VVLRNGPLGRLSVKFEYICDFEVKFETALSNEIGAQAEYSYEKNPETLPLGTHSKCLPILAFFGYRLGFHWLFSNCLLKRKDFSNAHFPHNFVKDDKYLKQRI
jgi:hypothetical protein